jgi:hypothetical protein
VKALAVGVFAVASVVTTPLAAAQPDLVDALTPDSTKLSTVVGRHVEARLGRQSDYVATYLAWTPRLANRLSLELSGALAHNRIEAFEDSDGYSYTATTTSATLSRAGLALQSGRYTLRAAAFLPGVVWGDVPEQDDDVQGILLLATSDELYGLGFGVSRDWRRERWSVTARLDVDLRVIRIEEDELIPIPQLAVGGAARIGYRVWGIVEASLRLLDPRIVRASAGADWVTPRVSAGLRLYVPYNGDTHTVLEYELQATLRY